MLAKPFGWGAHKNIAPPVLVEVWAARQRRPTGGAGYPAGTKAMCWRPDDFWFIN
jgi:hypothetical protein